MAVQMGVMHFLLCKGICLKEIRDIKMSDRDMAKVRVLDLR